MVEADADITMPELARALEDATGVQVAPASLSRALRRWGFRAQKKGRSLFFYTFFIFCCIFGVVTRIAQGRAAAGDGSYPSW
ncbi:MAG: winged helix-turn-helix domain-containing protein [Pseudomonadota bacterium]